MDNMLIDIENYDNDHFVDFFKKNNLLGKFINNLDEYGKIPDEQFFTTLSIMIIRQLDKSQHRKWCNRIKTKAKLNNSDYEYYLLFCISNRDRLTEILHIL